MNEIATTFGREVPPSGSKDAKIILVGEAPGKTETETGQPFSGRAGEILDRLLADCGIVRSACYITNVCKVRPPNNEFKIFRKKENKQFLKDSIEQLRREIEEIKPNIVMCLGAEALAAVLGDRRISARRGFVEWEDKMNVKVMGTYHPAAILRAMNLYPIALFDFQKMAEQAKTLSVERTNRIAKVSLNFEEVLGELERMKHCKKIAVDIENVAEGIDCIGLATSATEALTVPFLSDTGSIWLEEHEIILWKKIKELLENTSIQKVAQNAFYDVWHLQTQLGIHVKPVSFDTMLAAGMVNPEFPKNLWFLASMYTDHPFWEDVEDGLNEKRWKYNATDAMLTYEIAEKQERELRDSGRLQFFNELPMPLLPCMVRASITGLRFDDSRRNEFLQETSREYKRMLKELGDITEPRGGLNYQSYPQMCKYFIKGRGIKPIIDRGTKAPTFSYEALEDLSRKYPEIAEFPLIKQLSKLKERIDTLSVQLSKDNRIRCSYNIAGTETGRLSSSEAPDRSGMNLQNITPELRKLFLADEGCVLVKADLKQAENIIVAYLSGDPNMIGAIEGGGDLHAEIAAKIFRKSVQDISKQERQLGKKIGHASNYGMRPKRLQEVCWEEMQLKVTPKEAKAYMDSYYSAFPLIRTWHKKIQFELSKGRTLSNPFGRRRYFAGFWGDDLFREAYAYLPQGTIADLVSKAIICLDSIGLDIRLQVHDEIVVSCKKEEVEWTVARMRDAMERPFEINGRQVSIATEVKVGENWGETEEVEQWLQRRH